MPIARNRAEIVLQQSLPVEVAAPVYKGITVDTYKTDLSSIMMYVEGSSMITEYYSQVLGYHSELNPTAPTLPAPYQQYILTKEFEIKVTEPLQHTQNVDNNEMEVTGGGTIYAGLIPNAGDMFLADIGDGREGVFTILTSEKKTMFHSTMYAVTWLLTGVNGDVKRLELDSKVVKTVYFRKDFITYGQNPIIIESQVLNIEKLSKYLDDIKYYYFTRFYSAEYGTLVLPNQEEIVYDPYLVKSLTDMYNTEDHPILNKIRYLNIEGDPALKQPTVWDALMNLDKNRLRNCVKDMWTIPTTYWSQFPILKTIRFSGITSIVYPHVELNTVENQYAVQVDPKEGKYFIDNVRYDSNGDLIPWVDPVPVKEPFVVGSWDASTGLFPSIGGTGPAGAIAEADTWLITVPGTIGGITLIVDDFLKAVVDVPGQTPSNWVKHVMGTPVVPAVPLIRPVTFDNFYVFSEAFYTESETAQSSLEVQTNNLLSNRAVDPVQLDAMCQDWINWSLLDQYYYLPILMVIIRSGLRKI